MRAVSHAGISGVSVDALLAAAIASRENIVRTIGLTLAAASLAACAQSSVVSRNADFVPSTKQAAIEHRRDTRVAAREPSSVLHADLQITPEANFSNKGANCSGAPPCIVSRRG